MASAISLNPDLFIKLANDLLATEKGQQLCVNALEESQGLEAAQAMVAEAFELHQKYASVGAIEDQRAREEIAYYQELDKQAAARYNAASPAEKLVMDKLAALHGAVLEQLPTDIEKIAYSMGAQDGAAMMDSEGGEAGGEGTIPGAEGEAGPEEIMAMLEQLVQSGEITEEQAQQLIAELQGEMGGGAEGAMPEEGMDPMAAEGMPPEAKMASALLKELTPDLFKAPVVEEPKK